MDNTNIIYLFVSSNWQKINRMSIVLKFEFEFNLKKTLQYIYHYYFSEFSNPNKIPNMVFTIVKSCILSKINLLIFS